MHGSEFYTYRGLLKKIASIPFATRRSFFDATNFKIVAVKFHGVIFLCEAPRNPSFYKDSFEQDEENSFCEDEDMRAYYYGNKFEQLITSASKYGVA